MKHILADTLVDDLFSAFVSVKVPFGDSNFPAQIAFPEVVKPYEAHSAQGNKIRAAF